MDTEIVSVHGLTLDQLEHRLFAHWIGNDKSIILGMAAKSALFLYPPDAPRIDEADSFAAELALVKEYSINRLYAVRQLPFVDYGRAEKEIAEVIFSNLSGKEITVTARYLGGDDIATNHLKKWLTALRQESVPPSLRATEAKFARQPNPNWSWDCIFDWYYRQPRGSVNSLEELAKLINRARGTVGNNHPKYVAQYGKNPMPDDVRVTKCHDKE